MSGFACPARAQTDLEGLFRGGSRPVEMQNRSSNLNMPHRTTREMSQWISAVTAETLTFMAADINQELAKTAPYFSKTGHEAYLAFLKEAAIVKALQSQKYTVRSIVQGMPLLLNEGAVEGRYRWLFEVPVMISYLDRNMENYSKTDAINKYMILTVQVGRVKEEVEEIGVVIESWAAKEKKN